MGSSMVRYKVSPGRADENVALVEAVYAQLAEERPKACTTRRSGSRTA